MLRTEQISPQQIFVLVFVSRATTAVASLPVLTVGNAREDAWLAAFIATIAGTIVTWILATLALQFPDRTVIEYVHEMLGPVFGRMISGVFLWVFLEQSAIVLRQYGEALATAITPETPIVFVMGVMIALAAFGVRAGIEVGARMADLIFPVFLVATLSVVVLIGNIAEPAWLYPILGRGLMPVLEGAINPTVWFGELLFLLMILPDANNARAARAAACWGAAASGLMVVIISAATLMVFGAEEGSRLTFPLYSLARMISIGGFLERIDVIPMVAWGLGLYMKIGLSFYAGAKGLSQWLGIPEYRPLVLSMGAILLSMGTLMYENTAQFDELQLPAIWGVYRGTLTVVLPALLLLVALFYRRRSGKPDGGLERRASS